MYVYLTVVNEEFFLIQLFCLHSSFKLYINNCPSSSSDTQVLADHIEKTKYIYYLYLLYPQQLFFGEVAGYVRSKLLNIKLAVIWEITTVTKTVSSKMHAGFLYSLIIQVLYTQNAKIPTFSWLRFQGSKVKYTLLYENDKIVNGSAKNLSQI